MKIVEFLKNNQVIQKYKHIWITLVFAPVYLIWFMFLESKQPVNMYIVHMKIDDFIPFNELFVIPYIIWFFYVGYIIIFTFLKDKDEYYKACAFLYIGMIVFLIVSTIIPNGHNLRPSVMPRDNMFTRLVAGIYAKDTSTNIFPSIHVYNSIGVFIAVFKSKYYKRHNLAKIISFIISTLIILSTVFIKQHSCFDVITAFIMAIGVYKLVYKREKVKGFSILKNY